MLLAPVLAGRRAIIRASSTGLVVTDSTRRLLVEVILVDMIPPRPPVTSSPTDADRLATVTSHTSHDVDASTRHRRYVTFDIRSSPRRRHLVTSSRSSTGSRTTSPPCSVKRRRRDDDVTSVDDDASQALS